MVNKKKYELKKHVGTIQCSNSLSLIQRKISNALLFNAYHELRTKDEHVIDIKQLCLLIGYNSHDYVLIKTALKKLLSTILEWNILNEDNSQQDIWSASSILASVSIQGSNCIYSYSPRMKQLLYMPTMYGRVDLITQSKFKSSYALALYENCVRYQDLPYTGWIQLRAFRKLMGVEEDKYKIFRDFKRRIIDKAVSEVNLYSNLTVVPELKKAQRQVTFIRFKIAKNQKKDSQSEISFSENLYNQLISEWGMNFMQAKQVILSYPEKYIMEKIHVIKNSNTYLKGNIDKKSSYLLKVLNAEDEKQNSNISVKNMESTSNFQIIYETNKLKSTNAKDITTHFNCLQEKLKEKNLISSIVLQFEQFLFENHKHFLWRSFVKKKFDHKGIQFEFIQFVKKIYPDFTSETDSESFL